MSLPSGARLGPYQIVAPLGAGGMGEVYRARDAKLDRDVAIKVLPGQTAGDPGALARFEHEAKAVAALSHPNILAIFDFGHEHGTAYAVTELLEGETLREKLGQAAAPPRKAIEYAVQIARGLAAAHEKGIVHRDLKPENLFVTDSGQVKILDFGLARRGNVQPAGAETMSPTIGRLTDPGTVLGTAGYMSPEQVRGEAGDHRSDIFSFGAVLYELVTGRRAFQRGTPAETMTAILRDEPPSLTEQVSSTVPPAVGHIVHHCLEKSPSERFQSASDIAFALQALSGSSSSREQSLETLPARSRRGFWARTVVVAAAIATAGVVAGRLSVTAPAVVSFAPLTYLDQTIFRGLFAPNADTIVFSASLNGNMDDVEIFSISKEYPAPRSLGLENTQLLSISSRGELAVLTNARWIAHRFFDGTLARAPLGGGAPREILEHVREADWAPDGERLAIIRDVGGRDRLEFPIGTVLVETAGYLSDLRVSPKGDRVAFLEHPTRYDDRGGVAVVDLNGNKTMLADGYWGVEGLAWSKDANTVHFSAGLNDAQQFTVYAVTRGGKSRQALESAGGLTIYDIAPDGRWLAARDDMSRAMIVNAPGAAAEANMSWQDFSTPVQLARDGKKVLFTEQSIGSNYAVALRGTDGSPVVKLGEGTALDLSADGRLALAAVLGTARDELMVYPTGAGEPRRFDSGPIQRYTAARFFPDGNRIVACGNSPGKPDGCFLQDISGGPPRPIAVERAYDAWPSPDGMTLLVHLSRQPTADSTESSFVLYPVSGGPSRPVRGIRHGVDDVAGWDRDGKSVIVSVWERATLSVFRVDVSTGTRDLMRTLKATAAGTTRLRAFSVADDPNVYAYEVARQLSRMFLIRGAQ